MTVRMQSANSSITDSTLYTINSVVSPTPLTPAIPAAYATLSGVAGVNLRGSDILDSSTVSALISQQSATNGALDAASKIVQGIVPGTVGATLAQISNPGSMLKPGLDEFVQSKLNMGLDWQSSVSNSLLTGNYGARTVNDMLTNTTAQLAAVNSSIANSVNGLISNGVISGSEPATQISGLVLGASAFGVESVTGALSNIGSNISGTLANVGSSITGAIGNITTSISDKISGLSNMISSGNFASGVVDKLSSGIADSVTGVVSGAIGAIAGKLFGGGKSSITVEQLQQQLSSSARSAYVAAEASLVGTMKPNEANYLDSNVPQREYSESEELAGKIKSAELQLELADSAAISARIAYNENPSPENRVALEAAESKLSAAKQQSAAVASDVLSPTPKKRGGFFGGLKNPLSSVTEGINNVTSSIQTTVLQGIAVYDKITSAATLVSTAYATGGLSLLANSKLAGSLGALADPGKLAGDMLGKFTKSAGALGDSIGGLSGVIAGGEAKFRGMLSGLGGTKGVKTATYASNTDKNSASIASTTGQLLGNSTVPPPPTVTGETSTDLTPNEYIRAQSAAIQTLKNLEAQQTVIQLKIETLYAKLGDTTNSAILSQIRSAENQLASVNAQIASAQILYENTIRGA